MLEYIVQPGDTLGVIAKKLLGDASRYREFLTWNPDIDDPDSIEIGQVIKYPVMASPPPAKQSFQDTPKTSVIPAPAPLTAGVKLSVVPKATSAAPASSFKLPALLQDKKVMAAIALAVVAAVVLGSAPKKQAVAANPARKKRKRR